ncbi:hypothetical protein BPOR_0101g00020 [Botrytis porri]|uniref:Uncharacterized protein n=1 Tax=Botrytis porri TaxID=87229 RepID=A0A4Z1KYI0_9HELO|nr:hypothetical protein BPOR_0101g00020 [Botrytis porri]
MGPEMELIYTTTRGNSKNEAAATANNCQQSMRILMELAEVCRKVKRRTRDKVASDSGIARKHEENMKTR